ncbi:hypothetical protein GCM10023081_15810 [Arthrobacter ginkgonis]|uniref:YtxH domain-containing protein n=1 Tax=Arthrobacter ginkgonis TaxID=1630594 RepID=A0ABP7C6U4_9MICC
MAHPSRGGHRNSKGITIRILTLVAGGLAGYLLGARAGRESYDRIVDAARTFVKDPRTRQTLGDLGKTVKEKAPEASEAAVAAAASLKDKLHLRNGDKAGTAVAHEPDVESDPALSADLGRDWTDEGGATPAEPATSSV